MPLTLLYLPWPKDMKNKITQKLVSYRPYSYFVSTSYKCLQLFFNTMILAPHDSQGLINQIKIQHIIFMIITRAHVIWYQFTQGHIVPVQNHILYIHEKICQAWSSIGNNLKYRLFGYILSRPAQPIARTQHSNTVLRRTLKWQNVF